MIPMWVYGAGGLLVAAIGFGTGWTVREWKADSDELKMLEAGIEQGKRDQQLADFQAGNYEEQRYDAQFAAQGRDTEIRTIYRTEQVEVPARCEPPAAALGVLDRAIAAAAAQVAGEPIPILPAPAAEADPVR